MQDAHGVVELSCDPSSLDPAPKRSVDHDSCVMRRRLSFERRKQHLSESQISKATLLNRLYVDVATTRNNPSKRNTSTWSSQCCWLTY
jgi:hypothetical protein